MERELPLFLLCLKRELAERITQMAKELRLFFVYLQK